MRLLIAAVAVLLAAAPAHARPGNLDRTFAGGGRMAFPAGDTSAHVAGLALRGGLRPLLSVASWSRGAVVGSYVGLTATGRRGAAPAVPAGAVGAPRLAGGFALTPLSLDPGRYAFGPIGAAPVTLEIPGGPLQLTAFAADGSGRAVLVGSNANGPVVLRYLPSGALDTSYAGSLGPGFVPAAALVKGDGRVYVAGRVRGSRVVRLAGFDAHGRRIQRFSGRGRFAALRDPVAVVDGGRGRLLVAGYARGPRRANRPWIVRLDARGRIDRRFGSRGLAGAGRFWLSAVTRDRRGRVVLAGSREGRWQSQATVVRLTARGRRDRTFGRDGVVTKQLGALRGVNLVASEAYDVVVDDRNRIVVAGAAYDDDYAIRDDVGRSYPAIARLRG